MNLFTPDLLNGQAESFETLLQLKNVTIERIQSPPGTRTQQFIQPQDEWVCLLQGEAALEMADQLIQLHAGETLFIPANTPHRVLTTRGDPGCIWLAVHIG